MTFDEIYRRNPGALCHSEVVYEDGVAHAHLVKRVAAYRRHLHAGFWAVNFDQCGLHRVFRAASCSKSRMESGNLEPLPKNAAKTAQQWSLQGDYRRYQGCTRYTEKLDKPVNNREKHHKLIKLEKSFSAQDALPARPWQAHFPGRGRAGFKVLAFEPITACRVVGVKSSCARGMSGGLKSKNIGEK